MAETSNNPAASKWSIATRYGEKQMVNRKLVRGETLDKHQMNLKTSLLSLLEDLSKDDRRKELMRTGILDSFQASMSDLFLLAGVKEHPFVAVCHGDALAMKVLQDMFRNKLFLFEEEEMLDVLKHIPMFTNMLYDCTSLFDAAMLLQSNSTSREYTMSGRIAGLLFKKFLEDKE